MAADGGLFLLDAHVTNVLSFASTLPANAAVFGLSEKISGVIAAASDTGNPFADVLTAFGAIDARSLPSVNLKSLTTGVDGIPAAYQAACVTAGVRADTALGADDLWPLVTYLISQAKPSHLVVAMVLMEALCWEDIEGSGAGADAYMFQLLAMTVHTLAAITVPAPLGDTEEDVASTRPPQPTSPCPVCGAVLESVHALSRHLLQVHGN